MMEEIDNMKLLTHHNIISFVEFFDEGKDKWYVVMDLADQGSLKDYLEAR